MLSDEINRALSLCEIMDDEDIEQFAKIFWKKIKERRDKMDRENAAVFDVGDHVSFEGHKRDGSPTIVGRIMRVHQKTCKVKPDGDSFMTWRVPFRMLTHV